MKLLAVLMLAGCALATYDVPRVVLQPGSEQAEQLALDILKESHPVDTQSRNWLLDQAVQVVVNQAVNYFRNLINSGLDPLVLDHLHFNIPAGLVNLELELEDIFATGFGGFVAQRANLNIRTLLLRLEISVPLIDIKSKYDLLGDLFGAVPLYGKGDGDFTLENLSFSADVQLAQSEDGHSIIIESITNVDFDVPSFKSKLTGAIGGGDIDAIVNAIFEDVVVGYVLRFRGAVGIIAGTVVTAALNPILNTLDTWRFIAPFV